MSEHQSAPTEHSTASVRLVDQLKSPFPRRLIWSFPLVCLTLSVCSLAIDLPVVNALKQGHGIPGDLEMILHFGEAFGHGVGVLMIILSAIVLDPQLRRAVPRLLTASLGSGLVADLLKLIIYRIRPRDWEKRLGSIPETIDETFLAPFGAISDGYSSSFPSAHTTVACGFMVALAHYYPKARWLFAVWAILVGLQRIESFAHYPSDVFAGAALGWICGMACFHKTWLAGRFDKFEHRLKSNAV